MRRGMWSAVLVLGCAVAVAGLWGCGGEMEDEEGSLTQEMINTGGGGGFSLTGAECESLGCEVSSDGYNGCSSTWRCKCSSGSSCIDEVCGKSANCCGSCCRYSYLDIGCPKATRVIPRFPAPVKTAGQLAP